MKEFIKGTKISLIYFLMIAWGCMCLIAPFMLCYGTVEKIIGGIFILSIVIYGPVSKLISNYISGHRTESK